MSRITFDVTREQHQAIKTMATLHGKSIKDFVLGKLLPSDENNDEEAWQSFKADILERIKEAGETELIAQNFMEVISEPSQPAKR
jgi:uncharacterized protein (DUF1778 family)